jgi:cold shock protein
MARGTVKWFNPTKGYGFIQPQGGGRDVSVHISAVERAGLSTLNEGQHVEYEIEENRGKTSAVNLKVKWPIYETGVTGTPPLWFERGGVSFGGLNAPPDINAHPEPNAVLAMAIEPAWVQQQVGHLFAAKEHQARLSYTDRLVVLDRGLVNPLQRQGKTADGDSITLFAEFFLHFVNFLERERKRRPVVSWQDYALPHSRGGEP